MTEAYRRFEESLAGTDHASYTYDIAAYRALEGTEAHDAAAEIVARVDAGDPRAIETVGAVDLRAAVPALARWASGADERSHIARRALLRLGVTSPDDVVATLVTGSSQARIAAAQALGARDDATSQSALLLALDDPEVIVRVHAWNGLLRARDLTRVAAVRWSRLGRLAVALFTDLDAVRRPAAQEARAVFDAWDQDIDRPAVKLAAGPVPEVDRFVASMTTDTWDVDAVLQMPPLHATWARQVIIAALTRSDVRAAAALARLGDATATGALREAARRWPDFSRACERAIQAIDAP